MTWASCWTNDRLPARATELRAGWMDGFEPALAWKRVVSKSRSRRWSEPEPAMAIEKAEMVPSITVELEPSEVMVVVETRRSVPLSLAWKAPLVTSCASSS